MTYRDAIEEKLTALNRSSTTKWSWAVWPWALFGLWMTFGDSSWDSPVTILLALGGAGGSAAAFSPFRKIPGKDLLCPKCDQSIWHQLKPGPKGLRLPLDVIVCPRCGVSLDDDIEA